MRVEEKKNRNALDINPYCVKMEILDVVSKETSSASYLNSIHWSN